MEIKKEKVIREKYTEGHKRTKPVKYLVVHGTGGGRSAENLLAWMRNPNQKQQARYRRGVALFHYIIDRDGTVIEIIDPHNWVYHASIGKMDAGTIGVELLNPHRDNRSEYTQEQYQSLVELYDHLKGMFPLQKIFSHRYAKQVLGGGKKKNCPGNFDWDKFQEMIAEQTEKKGKDCLVLT